MACRLIRYQASIRTNDSLLLNWKYWNIRQWNSDQGTTVFIQGSYFQYFLSLHVLEYVRKVFGISKYCSEIKKKKKKWVKNVDNEFLCIH